MLKKFLSLALAILLCITVCACSGNSGADSDNNSTANGENTNVDYENNSDGNTENGNNTSDGTSGGSGENSTGGGGSGEQSTVITALNFKATATATNPTVMGMYYRNVVGQDFNIDNKTTKEIDKKADAMLKKIEDYPDTVKAKSGCKTYYISNSGDDKNDGLSPKTARATYLAVKTFLKPGDCVLFERGGLWRGQMQFVPGVSYGAYGKGIKPRFYGSVDASKSGGGKWLTTDTKDVYVFSKFIDEYSNIIFNNGEAIGRPVQKMEKITARELNVVYKSGKVYLYCPKGNPADVYDTIEIAEGYTLIGCSGKCENVRVQNFCVMFAGLHGIGPGQTNNFEMDGCVIGYIGGKFLYKGGISIGNGLELWGNVKDARVHDNYVFQCFDAGLTHQSNDQMKYTAVEEDIEYTNNLVEYCVYSFEAFTGGVHGPNGEYVDKMGKVTISNNISRFAGWGWGYLDRPDKGVPADVKYSAGSHVEPLIISNNIFDRSKLGAVRSGSLPDKSLLFFTNNQITANPKRNVMTLAGHGSISIEEDVYAYMKKAFADCSGTTVTKVPNK